MPRIKPLHPDTFSKSHLKLDPLELTTKIAVYGSTIRCMNKKPNLLKESILYSIMHNASIPDVILLNYYSNIYQTSQGLYNYGVEHSLYPLHAIFINQFRKFELKKALEKRYPLPIGKQHYVLSYSVDMLPILDLAKQAITIMCDKHKLLPNYAVPHSWRIESNYSVRIWVRFYVSPGPYEQFDELITVNYPIRYGAYYHYIQFYEQDTRTNKIDYSTYTKVMIDTEDSAYPEFNLSCRSSDAIKWFPNIPLGQFILPKHKDKDSYKVIDKCLKFIKLSAKDLNKAINEDPQSTNFQHSYLTLAIDLLYDNSQGSLCYAMEFFKKYWRNMTFQLSELKAYEIGDTDRVNIKKSTESMGDLFFGSGDTFAYSTDRISGVGVYVLDLKISNTIGYYQKRLCLEDMTLISDSDGEFFEAGEEAIKGIYIYHQINPTQCEVVRVPNIRSATSVIEVDKGFEAFLSDVPQNKHDKLQSKFLIPLTVPLLKDIPNKHASDAYYQSLKVSLYGWSEIHQKWYETELFRTLLNIGEIVIAIATQQYYLAVVLIMLNITGTMEKIETYLLEALKASIFFRALTWGLEKLGVPAENIALVYDVIILVAELIIGRVDASMVNHIMVSAMLLLAKVQVDSIRIKARQEMLEELDELKTAQDAKLDEIKQKRKEEGLDPDRDLGWALLGSLYSDVGMLPHETTHRYVERKLDLRSTINKNVDSVYGFHESFLDVSRLMNL